MTDRKTAEELNIKQEEYDALVKVRNGLASGCFVHVEVNSFGKPIGEHAPMGFNMSSCGAHGSCGTVACIGGWMQVIMQGKTSNPVEVDSRLQNNYVHFGGSTGSLKELFFPPCGVMDTVTTEQAVEAIDNFLTTGSPDWWSVTGRD